MSAPDVFYQNIFTNLKICDILDMTKNNKRGELT